MSKTLEVVDSHDIKNNLQKNGCKNARQRQKILDVIIDNKCRRQCREKRKMPEGRN